MDNGTLSSDKTDRRIVAVSLLGLLICFGLLSSEEFSQFIFGDQSEKSKAPIIGELSSSRNDIRHRSMDSLAWKPAKALQKVRAGDSIFSGESSNSTVALTNGSEVNLGSNSLIKFTTIDQIDLPNLAFGNFKVSVDGKIKVAVGGQITEISGKGSEVRVAIQANGRPRISVTKGSAQVKTAQTSKSLEKDQTLELQVAKAPVAPPENVVIPETPPDPTVVAKNNPTQLIYTDQLYDLYEQKNGRLAFRQVRPVLVNFPVPIEWETTERPVRIYGQLSATPDFTNIPQAFSEDAELGSGTFSRSLLGDNYYRLSADGKVWSETSQFRVIARPLDYAPPRLTVKADQLFIVNDAAELRGTLSGNFSAFIVELSTDPKFTNESSKIVYLKNRSFSARLDRAGSVYLRARGVDENQRVTALSAPLKIRVEKPGLPEAPRLAQSDIQMQVMEERTLSWPAAPRAKSYQVQVLDANGRLVATRQVQGESLKFRMSKPGRYNVKVKAQDAFGRASQSTADARLLVTPKSNVVLAEKSAPRQPTSDSGTITQKIDDQYGYFYNSTFRNSKLAFEGAAFSMFSSEQVFSEKDNPSALTAGVRWTGWLRSHGLEASAKTKVADATAVPGASVNPMAFEGRYLYRFDVPFNPLSKLNRSQLALIAGYEIYRNPSSQLFSSGYDLFKLGFSLAFPLWSRWDTGGEVLYGRGLEDSFKYEISGYIHYYLKKQWSMGLGYRLHLLEAGSTKVAPASLPYKEGFGEGYSVLRWHY